MKLSDVATIKTNFPDADFWIIRRGSIKTVGKPVEMFNSEHIGIRVSDTNTILPRFLFYVMEEIFRSGQWELLATGTTQLVNIRTSDVRNILLVTR
ncbi:hypothetical protein [Grimontia sp. SpTr1]|uniref:hypothetical protein n=1 Tax=Grimontia sp. SpTr1 TaxID=2995319 RepID=UPI00248C5735|nr:hypothetical protein [Grimontia sp. SpTr1]